MADTRSASFSRQSKLHTALAAAMATRRGSARFAGGGAGDPDVGERGSVDGRYTCSAVPLGQAPRPEPSGGARLSLLVVHAVTAIRAVASPTAPTSTVRVGLDIGASATRPVIGIRTLRCAVGTDSKRVTTPGLNDTRCAFRRFHGAGEVSVPSGPSSNVRSGGRGPVVPGCRSGGCRPIR